MHDCKVVGFVFIFTYVIYNLSVTLEECLWLRHMVFSLHSGTPIKMTAKK